MLLGVGLSRRSACHAALVVAGLATKRLDPQVLTQSTKSLRYRGEYWQGAWGVITDGRTLVAVLSSSPTFWWGVGPGNFGGPYLKHKLPTRVKRSSIPTTCSSRSGPLRASSHSSACWLHWPGHSGTSSALPRPPSLPTPKSIDQAAVARRRARALGHERPASSPITDDLPPTHIGWLYALRRRRLGLGRIFGWLDPFQGDLFVRMAGPRRRLGYRRHLAAAALEAAANPGDRPGSRCTRHVINLLAMGGIGIPTVALGLWSIVALGQNLRDDRKCSCLHEYESRMPALGLAVAWSALLGTSSAWSSRSGDPRRPSHAAKTRCGAPPNYEAAEQAFLAAATEDRYSTRPWLSLAALL